MEQSPIITPEDVAAELAANASLSQRFPEWCRQYQKVRERLLANGWSHPDEPSLAAAAPDHGFYSRRVRQAGESLCEPLPEDLQRKVSTLIHIEGTLLNSLDGEIDFWGAAWMGSYLAEAMLRFALEKPVRRMANALRQALAGSEPMRQVMETWLAGEHLTLAALSVMLRALRSLQELNPRELGSALAESFEPGYAGLVASGGPESCLEKLRNLKFLAEAQPRPVTMVDYLELIRLLVGARCLRAWNKEGPWPDPPLVDKAILHHHLRLMWITAPEAS